MRTVDGKPVLLLGLSGENITRLMAHEEIAIDAAQLGLPPMTVILMAGRTEADMAARLVGIGLLGPGATINGQAV